MPNRSSLIQYHICPTPLYYLLQRVLRKKYLLFFRSYLPTIPINKTYLTYSAGTSIIYRFSRLSYFLLSSALLWLLLALLLALVLWSISADVACRPACTTHIINWWADSAERAADTYLGTWIVPIYQQRKCNLSLAHNSNIHILSSNTICNASISVLV